MAVEEAASKHASQLGAVGIAWSPGARRGSHSESGSRPGGTSNESAPSSHQPGGGPKHAPSESPLGRRTSTSCGNGWNGLLPFDSEVHLSDCWTLGVKTGQAVHGGQGIVGCSSANCPALLTGSIDGPITGTGSGTKKFCIGTGRVDGCIEASVWVR